MLAGAQTAAWAATWGLAVTSVPRVVVSDRNAIAWATGDGGDLVVKWSGDSSWFGRLDALAQLLLLLADRGVPVAAPVTALDGRPRVVVDGPLGPLSVTVLPHVQGDWLDTTDRDAVRAAGAALAHLHAALADAPAGLVAALPPTRRGASVPLRAHLGTWLAEGDRGLVPGASRRLAALLADLPELDDDVPQLVHGDFRAANVLVRDGEVVAVLDVDDVSVRHRVDDLAAACTYLGTLFTGWAPTPPDAQRALVEGYESVRRLGRAERAWFDALLLWHGITAVPGPDDTAGWAAAVG
ncbi:aminoglycoside phosphotransferase [Streptomyces sp. NP160]|nr:aminoglycoside phosphotransferase [Streptomyces sp. NP160]